MKRALHTFLAAFIVFLTADLQAAPFTAGNVVVVRVGDGSSTLVNTGSPVFLDEYTPAGVLVQSIALATVDVGSNQELILSGTASSEGFLARSPNRFFLALSGYARTIGGTGSLSGTTATAVPRSVALIDTAGVVNTTTALTDYATGNNPRAAVPIDGTAFYLTGGAGGVRYATLGSTTSTQLSTTPTNIRSVIIANLADTARLLISTGSGTTVRVGTVGSGLPTTTGETITNLPGFPTGGSPNAFFFADLNPAVAGTDALYVAYDDTNGLKKFSLVSGSWTPSGKVGGDADDYRGVTGLVLPGGVVRIYATRNGGTTGTGGGELITVFDSSGYGGTFTATPAVLATAALNTAIRGVALSPVPVSGFLPIHITRFHARPLHSGSVELAWENAEAEPGAHFKVERSADGIHFQTIGRTANADKAAYKLYDDVPATGLNTYRLVCKKSTGGQVCATASVYFGSQEQASAPYFVVEANPIPGDAAVFAFSQAVVPRTLVVFSADGQMVASSEILPGTTGAAIDVSRLAAGIYFATLPGADGRPMHQSIVVR